MRVTPLVLLALSLLLDNADCTRCYDPTRDFYPYKGAQTVYDLVHGYIQRPDLSCQPMHIWVVGSPGTHCPISNTELIKLHMLQDEILKNHDNNRGQLCKKDLDGLRRWRIVKKKFTHSCERQGKHELTNLAQRLAEVFPELLQVDPHDFNPHDYEFHYHNNETLARKNQEPFVHELFDTVDHLLPTIKLNNMKLDTTIEFNNDHNSEYEEFLNSSDAHEHVKNISERLGFTENLKYETIELMFKMCSYEIATISSMRRNSSWCALFTRRDAKFYEFSRDLFHYYREGPGNHTSKRLGYELLLDIANSFKIERTHQLKGSFMFGSDLPPRWLVNALEVGKPSAPLRSTDFSNSEHRTYRSSWLMPVALNFIAVKYRCNDNEISAAQNRVMFYINEKLIRSDSALPNCQWGLCDLEDIINQLRLKIDETTTTE